MLLAQAASQHTFLLRSGSLKGGSGGGGASSGAALGTLGVSPQPQSPGRGLSCAWRPTSPRKHHHACSDEAGAACTGAGLVADVLQKLPGGFLPDGGAAAPEGGAKAVVWEKQRLLLVRGAEGAPGALLGGGGRVQSPNRPGRVQLGSLFDPVVSSARLLRSSSQL